MKLNRPENIYYLYLIKAMKTYLRNKIRSEHFCEWAFVFYVKEEQKFFYTSLNVFLKCQLYTTFKGILCFLKKKAKKKNEIYKIDINKVYCNNFKRHFRGNFI